MANENLIKSTNNLTKDDLSMLREKFISEYARKKGWDKNQLTPDQLLEIVQQKGYSNPGIIKS
jgi:hypothetical protein